MIGDGEIPLLTCPFCGGDASEVLSEDACLVGCGGEDCEVGPVVEKPPSGRLAARKAWNRRTA